jgi:hypothetical protein
MSGGSALSEDMPPPGSASSMDTGHSTKLTAVLKNIEDNIQGSKRFYSTLSLRPPTTKSPKQTQINSVLY